MAQQDPGIFQGGQMTDLPVFTGPFTGTELMELVSPGSRALGINYSVTFSIMATYIAGLIGAGTPTILKNSANYNSVNTDTRILVENTSGALTTSIVLLAAANYSQPILVKDIYGNASDTNPITVTFSGGQLGDGLASVSITNPYGAFWFTPLPTSATPLAGFYLGTG